MISIVEIHRVMEVSHGWKCNVASSLHDCLRLPCSMCGDEISKHSEEKPSGEQFEVTMAGVVHFPILFLTGPLGYHSE